MKKTAFLLSGILILTLVAGVFAQEGETSVGGGSDINLSVGQILNECNQFKWPLVAILAFGIFLGILQAVMLLMEALKANALRRMSFYKTSMKEIEELLKGKAGSTELGHLLGILFTIGMSGKHSKGEFLNEIVRAARMRQERFRTFRNWMVFLSDSAGALGLLGTVFGMYTTFRGGSLDPSHVIAGMGIALSTTLVGIIISLILNLVSTALNNIFDKQLEVTYQKGDELRFSFEKLAVDEKIPGGAEA